MIKLRAQTTDGRPMIVVGLSHENLDRLRAGKPIDFDLGDIGLVGECFIFAGETEDEMMENLCNACHNNDVPVLTGEPPKASLKPN